MGAPSIGRRIRFELFPDEDSSVFLPGQGKTPFHHGLETSPVRSTIAKENLSFEAPCTKALFLVLQPPEDCCSFHHAIRNEERRSPCPPPPPYRQERSLTSDFDAFAPRDKHRHMTDSKPPAKGIRRGSQGRKFEQEAKSTFLFRFKSLKHHSFKSTNGYFTSSVSLGVQGVNLGKNRGT